MKKNNSHSWTDIYCHTFTVQIEQNNRYSVRIMQLIFNILNQIDDIKMCPLYRKSIF